MNRRQLIAAIVTTFISIVGGKAFDWLFTSSEKKELEKAFKATMESLLADLKTTADGGDLETSGVIVFESRFWSEAAVKEILGTIFDPHTPGTEPDINVLWEQYQTFQKQPGGSYYEITRESFELHIQRFVYQFKAEALNHGLLRAKLDSKRLAAGDPMNETQANDIIKRYLKHSLSIKRDEFLKSFKSRGFSPADFYYVPPRVVWRPDFPGKPESATDTDDAAFVWHRSLTDQTDPIIIVGDGGVGKSTYLRRLEIKAIKSQQTQDRPLLPLCINAAKFKEIANEVGRFEAVVATEIEPYFPQEDKCRLSGLVGFVRDKDRFFDID